MEEKADSVQFIWDKIRMIEAVEGTPLAAAEREDLIFNFIRHVVGQEGELGEMAKAILTLEGVCQ